VSNANDVLDPSELSQGHVSRSKDVIAAATADLAYHHRWLKDYLASEERSRKRRIRLVRRQQARQRRRIIRRRLARYAGRAALGLARAASSIYRSLLKGAYSILTQIGGLALRSASRVASTSYALSGGLLRLLFISLSWIGAKGHAFALLSLQAAFTSLSWIVVRARVFALVSLRAASRGSTWIAARTRTLALLSLGALLACVAWTSAKSRGLARSSLSAAATGGSWLGGRMNALALASGSATSSGLSWATAKSYALALRSREAASISFAWSAAKTRTLARGLRREVSGIASLIRAKLGDVVLALHHAASTAYPQIRAAGRDAAIRVSALRAAARRAALHQSDRASLFALRLNTQAKAEIDALRRAARSGELSWPSWRKFLAIASPRKAFAYGWATEEELTGPAAAKRPESEGKEYATRNALVCVEPWHRRLPAVRAEKTGGPLAALYGHSRGAV
jgi:hypothetical protein